MKKYILIFGPPGVGLGESANKLSQELNAEIMDIEEEIKNNPKTEKALESIGATFTRPIDSMETVAHNIPRSTMKELWMEATARCLKKLEESNNPVNILSGHLVYYCGKRNEFYSVIDPGCLMLKAGSRTRFKPACILWLTDDIYDMYTRLPDLYSPNQIDSFLRKLQRDLNIDVKALPEDRLSSLVLGWEVRNLLHLLSWRHLEPVIAENLALQLGVRFLAWPTKQLIESLKPWLSNSQPLAIYLSHPISEARRERNESTQWPEFTNEVNRIQNMLSQQHITLVMPAAIDELRFNVKNQQYTGYLDPRWGLIDDNDNTLLYSQPDITNDINYNTLLRPKCWSFQEQNLFLLKDNQYTEALKSEVNAFLQILVREVEAQISSRDFLFIYHTKGLMVYRPYYARTPRPTFSSGVDAEVKLWRDIVRLGEQKLIAFVHSKKDVQFVLEAKKDDILEQFVDEVWGLLSDGWNIHRSTVHNMVENKGDIHEIENILNRMDIAQKDQKKLRAEFPTHWKQAKIELLKKYLTSAVEVKEEFLGTWVLNDFDELRTEVSNIAGFLRNGTPKSNNWEQQIDSLFPDSFITEGT